jgi:hypothetical protein
MDTFARSKKQTVEGLNPVYIGAIAPMFSLLQTGMRSHYEKTLKLGQNSLKICTPYIFTQDLKHLEQIQHSSDLSNLKKKV